MKDGTVADGHLIRKMQRGTIVRVKNRTILDVDARSDPDRSEIRPDNRLAHHGNLIAKYDVSTYVRGLVDKDIEPNRWL